MMRKNHLPLGLILLLLITLFASRRSHNNSIALLEAYEIATAEAIKWDASAKPYFITSVDDSVKNYSVKGEDGTRSYWNFDFVVEGTEKHLIITIHNKSIVSRIEVESTVNPEYIINIADLHISTADAVTIARNNYGLLPGILHSIASTNSSFRTLYIYYIRSNLDSQEKWQREMNKRQRRM